MAYTWRGRSRSRSYQATGKAGEIFENLKEDRKGGRCIVKEREVRYQAKRGASLITTGQHEYIVRGGGHLVSTDTGSATKYRSWLVSESKRHRGKKKGSGRGVKTQLDRYQVWIISGGKADVRNG